MVLDKDEAVLERQKISYVSAESVQVSQSYDCLKLIRNTRSEFQTEKWTSENLSFWFWAKPVTDRGLTPLTFLDLLDTTVILSHVGAKSNNFEKFFVFLTIPGLQAG